MNALVPIAAAPTAGPHGEGHTIFSPRRQADFLANLQLFGNVRLAARVSVRVASGLTGLSLVSLSKYQPLWSIGRPSGN